MDQIEKVILEEELFNSVSKEIPETNKDSKVIEIEFDAISQTYDVAAEAVGYPLAREGAMLLSQYIMTDDQILDAGCGTGLVGENLSRLGYYYIEGLDISAKSLEIAGSKNVYKSLYKLNIQERLPFKNDSFKAAICIDVFSRFNSDELIQILAEFSRVTTEGGFIIFSQYDNLENVTGIERNLECVGGLELHYVSDSSQVAPLSEEHKNIYASNYVLKNLKTN